MVKCLHLKDTNIGAWAGYVGMLYHQGYDHGARCTKAYGLTIQECEKTGPAICAAAACYCGDSIWTVICHIP
jgi:hypothetical protein